MSPLDKQLLYYICAVYITEQTDSRQQLFSRLATCCELVSAVAASVQ